MYATISESTAVPETPLTVSRKTTPKYKGRFSIKLDCTRNSRHSKLSSFGVPKSLGDPPADRCRILTAMRAMTIAIVHKMKITKPQRGKVIFVGSIWIIFLGCETAANTLENLPVRNLGESCRILVNYCLRLALIAATAGSRHTKLASLFRSESRAVTSCTEILGCLTTFGDL